MKNEILLNLQFLDQAKNISMVILRSPNTQTIKQTNKQTEINTLSTYW